MKMKINYRLFNRYRRWKRIKQIYYATLLYPPYVSIPGYYLCKDDGSTPSGPYTRQEACESAAATMNARVR